MKKVLITGASSGIGAEMAKIMSEKGYFVILAARRKDRLEALAKELKNPCSVICTDLGACGAPQKLFEENRDIDILINNAGFGVFGEFTKTPLPREEEMLRVNILALHTLTKLYLSEFKRKNQGKILNVASSAAFFPGPMFSSYYASKAYVLRLSRAVSEELRREKSAVTISVLCPGPVRTEFNDVAGVNFGIGSISAQRAAREGIDGMFRKKKVIVPSLTVKATHLLSKIFPESLSARIVYKMQRAKMK